MTQEEKANAYDEAIEALGSLFAEQAIKHCDRVYIKDITNIFPELKESEDERIRKALMQNLKERFGTKGNMGEGLDMPDVLAYLEKQGEQKSNDIRTTGYWLVEDVEQKPAWSEEDENRVNRLIAYFEDKESFTAEDDIVYANWLKSLRERYTWKPSDEQMEILQYLCENSSHPNKKVMPTLKSLYQDLKKLREE